MQLFAKQFDRLGAAFTSPPIAQLLNNLKAPYSISSPTSALGMTAFSPAGLAVKHSNVSKIIEQRDRLLTELPKIPGIGRFLGGRDANFLLVEILSAPEGGKPCNTIALKAYQGLAETRGVVVRFRGKEAGCNGCLRMTVGTEAENTRLLEKLRGILVDIYAAPA